MAGADIPYYCPPGGTVTPPDPPCDVPPIPVPAGLPGVPLCLPDGSQIIAFFSVGVPDNVPCPPVPAETPGECIAWYDVTSGAWTEGCPPADAGPCGETRDFELSGCFCDIQPDGSVAGVFFVEFEYDEETGELSGTRTVDVNGDEYVVTGTAGKCPSDIIHPVCLCDDDDSDPTTAPVPFLRWYAYTQAATQIPIRDSDLEGAPYTVVGTVGKCPDSATSVEKLCDDVAGDCSVIVPFFMVNVLSGGVSIGQLLYELDMITPYIPVGEVICCVQPCQPYLESFTGEAAPAVLPFNSLLIHKPACCELTVTTDAGVVTLPAAIQSWSPECFDCDLTTITLGGDPDCIAGTTLIVQHTGERKK